MSEPRTLAAIFAPSTEAIRAALVPLLRELDALGAEIRAELAAQNARRRHRLMRKRRA